MEEIKKLLVPLEAVQADLQNRYWVRKAIPDTEEGKEVLER